MRHPIDTLTALLEMGAKTLCLQADEARALVDEVEYLRRIASEVAKMDEAMDEEEYQVAASKAMDYLDPEWP